MELHGEKRSDCRRSPNLSTSFNETGIKFRKSISERLTGVRGGGVCGRSSPKDSLRARAKGSSSNGESLGSEGDSSGEATKPGIVSVGNGAERSEDLRLRIGPVVLAGRVDLSNVS